MSSLANAIIKGKSWIQRFTRYEYRDAFKEYKEQHFSDCYTEISGSDDLKELALCLTEELDASVARMFFLNRAGARVDIKMMIVSFFVPMLLENKECLSFCEIFRDTWNERKPEDKFEISDYEKILNGFRHSILGIDLERKHFSREKDR